MKEIIESRRTMPGTAVDYQPDLVSRSFEDKMGECLFCMMQNDWEEAFHLLLLLGAGFFVEVNLNDPAVDRQLTHGQPWESWELLKTAQSPVPLFTAAMISLGDYLRNHPSELPER